MSNDPVSSHDDFVNQLMNKKLMEGKTGTIYIPELLAKIGEYKTREEKIRVLHANQSPALLKLFDLCYSDDIDWDFSRRDLDHIKIKGKLDIADYDMAPSSLFRMAMKLDMFTNRKKQGNRMSKEKALKVIGEWFSAMHQNDIEVIKQVVDGNFTYKGVTRKLISAAFPQLLPVKEKLPFDQESEDDKIDSEQPISDDVIFRIIDVTSSPEVLRAVKIVNDIIAEHNDDIISLTFGEFNEQELRDKLAIMLENDQYKFVCIDNNNTPKIVDENILCMDFIFLNAALRVTISGDFANTFFDIKEIPDAVL